MLDSFRRWTKTEHELCREDLSAYLDGQLAPRERARVEKHLKACAQCRAELETLRHTVALLRMVPTVKPPRSFLLPAGELSRQPSARRQRFAYASLRLATAVATALLVLVVSGDALLRYALPAPGGAVSDLQVEPTMMFVGQPETVDETTNTTLSSPQPVAQPSTVESQPDAGAAGPVAGATSEAAVEALGAREAQPESTPPPPASQLAVVTKTRPPRTSAVSAAPPAAPTAESAEAPSTPAPETPLPTETPPVPTETTVPPTSVPEPTATAVSPSPTPLIPEAVVGPPVEPAAKPLWQGVIEAARSVLPRLELALATLTLVLLVITLWVRRGQRAV